MALGCCRAARATATKEQEATRLEITQQHIDDSDRNRKGHDPISLALKPYLVDCWECHCQTGYVRLRRYTDRGTDKYDIWLDSETSWLMTRWRTLGQDVEPFVVDCDALDFGRWRKRPDGSAPMQRFAYPGIRYRRGR